MTRIIISSFCFIVFSTNAFAQVGIYKSYQSFVQDHLDIEYAEYLSVFHIAGNFKVAFRDSNGKKIKIKCDKKKIWGYQTAFGKVYRIDQKNDPYLIIENGKILVYTNYSTKLKDDGTVSFNENQFQPKFSIGPDSEMIPLRKGKLKKALKNEPEEILRLKGIMSTEDLYNFIVGYNNRHKENEAKYKVPITPNIID